VGQEQIEAVARVELLGAQCPKAVYRQALACARAADGDLMDTGNGSQGSGGRSATIN
jgi:hypothetical protein